MDFVQKQPGKKIKELGRFSRNSVFLMKLGSEYMGILLIAYFRFLNTYKKIKFSSLLIKQNPWSSRSGSTTVPISQGFCVPHISTGKPSPVTGKLHELLWWYLSLTWPGLRFQKSRAVHPLP